MRLIECIRDFISDCPLLQADKVLGIDMLEEGYSIDVLPVDPIYEKYVDGTEKRIFEFIFATSESYSETTLQQLENSGFQEKFQNWIEKANYTRNLPVLGDGRIALKLEIVSSGYVADAESATARYEMHIRMYYLQMYYYYNLTED